MLTLSDSRLDYYIDSAYGIGMAQITTRGLTDSEVYALRIVAGIHGQASINKLVLTTLRELLTAEAAKPGQAAILFPDGDPAYVKRGKK